jgi:release factor glutamine methyltransferase
VSNPPYVSVHDHDALPPSVRDFEPHTALFAGRTGLDVIEPLLDATTRALAPGGWLGMEIGAGQAASVMRLSAAQGFTDARMLKDLAGIERTLVARRPA